MVTAEKTNRKTTINDLELAGALLGLMTLETKSLPLTYTHLAHSATARQCWRGHKNYARPNLKFLGNYCGSWDLHPSISGIKNDPASFFWSAQHHGGYNLA